MSNLRILKPVILASTTLLAAILLQGCSGHPGAGHWEASSEVPDLPYSALELEFDGKGTLHPNTALAGQEDNQDLWCVWQAKSAIALDVQCGDGSAEKTNIKFELVVAGEKQEGAFPYTQANLQKDGSVVTVFSRKL